MSKSSIVYATHSLSSSIVVVVIVVFVCIYSRFQVFMEYHQMFQLKMISLYVILEQILSAADSSSDELRVQMNQLLADMNALYSMLVKRLNNLLLQFDLTVDNDLNEISFMVRLVEELKFDKHCLLGQVSSTKQNNELYMNALFSYMTKLLI